jgi:hypothetical protein
VTSEDLQNAMHPRQQGVQQAGEQAGQAGERFEDGQETPDGGADWPHVAAVPAAIADPGLSPEERAIAAAGARQGERRRRWKAIE